MSNFEEFYTGEMGAAEMPSLKASLRRAFEAGQASRPAVITAYQLQAEIGKFIAAHDAETRAITEGLPIRIANMVEIVRATQIADYRRALDVVMRVIDEMEHDREAQP